MQVANVLRVSFLPVSLAVVYLSAAVLCGCNGGRKSASESLAATRSAALTGTGVVPASQATSKAAGGQRNTPSGIASRGNDIDSIDTTSRPQTVAEAMGNTAQPLPFNLFAPPKADLPVVRQSQTRKENEPIRLIGFVNVDRLKALLAFDGKMRAMEVGESYHDVEVVAIEPPKITLQRGNERWITTLFDQPVVHDNQATAASSSVAPEVTVGIAQSTGVLAPLHVLPVFPGGGRTPGPSRAGQPVNADNYSPAGAYPSPAWAPGQPPSVDQLPLPSLPEFPPLPSVEPRSDRGRNR